ALPAVFNPWIGVNRSDVFWTLNGAEGVVVSSCPISGCTSAPSELRLGGFPTALAVDDTHVYWATPGITTNVNRSSLADGRSEVIFTMMPSISNGLLIFEMMVSGADLYVVTGSSGSVKRAVSTLPKDGSGPLVPMADDQHLAQ